MRRNQHIYDEVILPSHKHINVLIQSEWKKSVEEKTFHRFKSIPTRMNEVSIRRKNDIVPLPCVLQQISISLHLLLTRPTIQRMSATKRIIIFIFMYVFMTLIRARRFFVNNAGWLRVYGVSGPPN